MILYYNWSRPDPTYFFLTARLLDSQSLSLSLSLSLLLIALPSFLTCVLRRANFHESHAT